jgi:nitrate/nitrite transport system substrate-binding protein
MRVSHWRVRALAQLGVLLLTAGCGGRTESGGAASADPLATPTAVLEKRQVKLGFIKLTDMAPLAVAYENGYFEDEGLFVTLEPQANWKVLLDRVIDGELDGAHMLAGQPIASTIGFGTKADVITAFSMDLNGNATTVSNEVWARMTPYVPRGPDGRPIRSITARSLKPVVEAFKAEGRPFKMAMVFPVSTHNYELRYWLAAGGLHPGFYAPSDVTGQIQADVQISVTPPPQMPSTLEAGTIHGYSVGEPWNQQAIARGIGVPVVTDYEIWKDNPEKVFGVTAAWAEKHPNTHVAIVKALIRAAMWLDADDGANRKQAAQLISRSEYVGADYEVIANSMTGTFEYEKGEVRDLPNFNVFFKHFATYPFYSDAVWYLTQMRRWGQIAEAHPDEWYHEVATRVYRPDIYRQAANQLLEKGSGARTDFPLESDGFRPPTSDFIDGVEYDGRFPNAYLAKFAIGLKGSDIVSPAHETAGP